MELVVALLHDVFELPRDKAIATMRAVHEHGSAVVGRYPSEVGRDRVRAARARATEQGAPLWIELANL
jgi:ATP-dependent Clp protease adapter protein ClpS